MIKIRFLDIMFENPIEAWEVPYLRGAIIQMAGKQNILFHNHQQDEGFRYGYPLIQYKRIDKKPHLICIEDGVDEIHNFFEKRQEGVLLGSRPYEMNVEGIQLNRHVLQVWDKSFKYYLQEWIPFNEKNYTLYNTLTTESEKKVFLESILKGNIISMAKGIGWEIDKEIKLEIVEIKGRRHLRIKDVVKEVMTLTFTTNVSLPNYLGLGRNVSLGYGTVRNLSR